VARELGADVVIDRKVDDVVAAVKTATDGRGVDVVYDPVGGTAYTQSTKCIAFEGRILIIGFAGGEIPSAALNHVLIKNYSVIGLHWGLYRERDPGQITKCQEELTALAAAGKLRPLVSERLALPEIPAGLQRLAAGDTVGRIAYVGATAPSETSSEEHKRP
jgi:NADPH2:quinone reductase